MLSNGQAAPDSSSLQNTSAWEFGNGKYELPTKALDMMHRGLRDEIDNTCKGDNQPSLAWKDI